MPDDNNTEHVNINPEDIEHCEKHNIDHIGGCIFCKVEDVVGQPWCDDCKVFGHEAGTSDCPMEMGD